MPVASKLIFSEQTKSIPPCQSDWVSGHLNVKYSGDKYWECCLNISTRCLGVMLVIITGSLIVYFTHYFKYLLDCFNISTRVLGVVLAIITGSTPSLIWTIWWMMLTLQTGPGSQHAIYHNKTQLAVMSILPALHQTLRMILKYIWRALADKEHKDRIKLSQKKQLSTSFA